MPAAEILTSLHNPHTRSSDDPLSYATAETQEDDYPSAYLSTSSETKVLQLSGETSTDSTYDSFAFVNGGYISPVATRKTPTNAELPELEEMGKSENMAGSEDNLCGGFICPYIATEDPDFIDNVPTLSVSASVRPQIHVKLIRAKSPSNESIHDNSWESEEKSDSPSTSLDDNNSRSTTTPFFSHKRGWYLQKVGAFFKRKFSKSLNNITCQSTDDLRDPESGQSQIATVLKSQSYSTNLNVAEPRLERLTKVQIKEKMRAIHAFLREGRTKKNEDKSSEELHNRLDRSMDTDERSVISSSQGQVHTPEGSCSLSRRHSQLSDSSQVNSTRKTSLNPGKFHIVSHRQFTTSSIPQTDGEVPMIKDATHIQPLENGDAVVTDILCSNMVLFGVDGHPKITFSCEAGSEPYATCLTPDGCLAVTLKGQGCVALWSTSGEPVTEFGHSVLSGPAGIQCDHHGRFIVADEQANSIFIFSQEGELMTKLDSSTLNTESPATNSLWSQDLISPCINLNQNSFKKPRYVCLTHSGNYVIADSANHCIKIFDQNMQFVTQFGRYGRGNGCFKFPYGVASDEESNIYVADHFNNRVSIFSAKGEFIQHLLTLQDGIARPKSVAVCRSLLYVTHGDIWSSKVSVFTLKS